MPRPAAKTSSSSHARIWSANKDELQDVYDARVDGVFPPRIRRPRPPRSNPRGLPLLPADRRLRPPHVQPRRRTDQRRSPTRLLRRAAAGAGRLSCGNASALHRGAADREEGCPDESQVGMADVTTLVVGIFVHTIAGVRSDGDYGIEAATHDVFCPRHPADLQRPGPGLGRPLRRSTRSNPRRRGMPRRDLPGPRQKTAFLTMPTDCPGESKPSPTAGRNLPAFEERETFYESADPNGNPV